MKGKKSATTVSTPSAATTPTSSGNLQFVHSIEASIAATFTESVMNGLASAVHAASKTLGSVLGVQDTLSECEIVLGAPLETRIVIFRYGSLLLGLPVSQTASLPQLRAAIRPYMEQLDVALGTVSNAQIAI